jgi:hypothetical protein
VWLDQFCSAQALAPALSSFAASIAAPLYREIPSATVMSRPTSAEYRKAKGAIQDVVFHTFYILSATNVQYGGRLTVRGLKKPLLERVESKESRSSVKHYCV